MNSTNIKVISEEIQRLKDKVHAIDIEVPDPSQATDGQILSVDEGKYVISDPELPSYSVSDEGKYLGVDSSGDLEFSNPPGKYNLDYSTTEIDTGIKWIDNRSVFRIVIDGDFPVIESTQSYVFAVIENIRILDFNGMLITNTGVGQSLANFSVGINEETGNIYALSLSNAFSEGHYTVIIEYVKTPTPEPSLTSTRKKTTKKGE